MKYLLSILTTFLLFTQNELAASIGIDPVKIEPITKATYDYSFYARQTELWKKETEAAPDNADAWFNYYQAARYANIFAEPEAKKFNLDSIVGSMPVALANTFEFNYIQFNHQTNWTTRYDHLLKAHELAPERAEAYRALINYYIAEGDEEKVTRFCRILFDADEFKPSLLAWNYNMLVTIEKDGILLTHGDNDTYPAWVLQRVKNTRKDVRVLNVNLLMHDAYREKVFAEIGLSPVNAADHSNYQDMYLAITRQFMQQATRPVYVATSVPEHIRNVLGDSLYLVGLAFKYDRKPFDNLAFLKNNYEKKFLKDHLHIQLEPDTGSNVIASMNMHYLPAMLLLHKHYLESGEPEQASVLEPLIRQIANKAGRSDYVAPYLDEPTETTEDLISTLSIRKIQKEMMPVRKNLYAAATEVTNEQYEAFLMDLLKNKEYELLEICKAPKTNWRSLLPDEFHHLSDQQLFINGHPEDGQSPVQNISFEAAEEYCKWITKVYNNSTDKKKEYGQVEFRLPSEEEWEYAARGNRTGNYPWGGYYYRNAKGCFLLNTEVSGEEPCKDCSDKTETPEKDGSFFTVYANAYFPNDFGLYNCSGNVAEMISVKGVAKGGSWGDHPDDAKIISVKKYDAPSPAIGFRVFMEVK